MAPHPFLAAAWVSWRPGLSRALQQDGAAAERDAHVVVDPLREAAEGSRARLRVARPSPEHGAEAATQAQAALVKLNTEGLSALETGV